MEPTDFLNAYESALAAQDWEEVAPLFHPNVCISFSNGTVHKGKKNVKIAFERNFEMIKGEAYKMSDIHWVIANENIAVYLFQYNWQGIINGQTMAGKGRGTSTLIFQDKQWRLLSEHLGPAA